MDIFDGLDWEVVLDRATDAVKDPGTWFWIMILVTLVYVLSSAVGALLRMHGVGRGNETVDEKLRRMLDESMEAERARMEGLFGRGTFASKEGAVSRHLKEQAAQEELTRRLRDQGIAMERLQRTIAELRKATETQPRREQVVKKYWIIVSPINNGGVVKFDNFTEAMEEAQRQTKTNPVDVLELRARTKVPVPDVRFTELPMSNGENFEEEEEEE